MNYADFDCLGQGYDDVFRQAVEEGITMASQSQERLTLLGKLAVLNLVSVSTDENTEIKRLINVLNEADDDTKIPAEVR